MWELGSARAAGAEGALAWSFGRAGWTPRRAAQRGRAALRFLKLELIEEHPKSVRLNGEENMTRSELRLPSQ